MSQTAQYEIQCSDENSSPEILDGQVQLSREKGSNDMGNNSLTRIGTVGYTSDLSNIRSRRAVIKSPLTIVGHPIDQYVHISDCLMVQHTVLRRPRQQAQYLMQWMPSFPMASGREQATQA